MNKLIISFISIIFLFFVSCFSSEQTEKQKEKLVEYPTTYNLVIENKGGVDIDLSCLSTGRFCTAKLDFLDYVNEFNSETKNKFVKLTLLSTTTDSIRYTIEIFKIRNENDTLRTSNGGVCKNKNNCEDIAETLCKMINK